MKAVFEIREAEDLKKFMTIARKKNVINMFFSTRMNETRTINKKVPVVIFVFKTEKIAQNMLECFRWSRDFVDYYMLVE